MVEGGEEERVQERKRERERERERERGGGVGCQASVNSPTCIM